MFRLVVIAGLLLAGLSTQAHAGARDCSAEARDDVKAIARDMTGWSDLYRYYRVYPSCDNDPAAKSLGGAVAGLMTEHWDEVTEVRNVLRQDKDFSGLVLSHINTGWNKDEIAAARLNATEHCPTALDSFCTQVVAKLDEMQHP